MISRLINFSKEKFSHFEKSFALISGYVIGQGSAFLANASLLALGKKESAGALVMITSGFALAILFSDLANSARLTQMVSRRDFAEIEKFLFGRAAIGLILTAPACWMLAYQISSAENAILFGFGGGLSAYIFGRSENGIKEAAGHYWRYCLVQAAPWTITSAIAFTVMIEFGPKKSITYLAILLPIVALIHRRLGSARWLNYGLKAERSKLIPSIKAVLPYVFGTISGQTWGRVALVLIAVNIGVSGMGEFGLLRQLEISSILILGFALRPQISAVAAAEGLDNKSKTKALEEKAMPILLAAFVISMLALSFSIATNIFDLPTYFNFAKTGWLPLLGVIFPSVLSSISLASIHLTAKRKEIIKLETAALVGNIAIFMTLIRTNPMGALILAEVFPGIAYLVGKKYIKTT